MSSFSKTFLIYGVSKGLGKAIAELIPDSIDTVYGVSRSAPEGIDNLKLSDNAKVILIGSTWGVDNHNGKELILSATKFALRGVAQSLKEILREDLIGVSILNLGYLATEYEINIPTELIFSETNHLLIPL
jgi:short-subunit dehydrogenase